MNDEQTAETKDGESGTRSAPSKAQPSGEPFLQLVPLSSAEIRTVEVHARLDDLARLIAEQPRIVGETIPGSERSMYDVESAREVQILFDRLIIKVAETRLRESVQQIAAMVQRLSDVVEGGHGQCGRT